MTHTYQISGMTCSGCQAKVQALLTKVPGVERVVVDLEKAEAVIDMEQHVATENLQAALAAHPNYQLVDKVSQQHSTIPYEQNEESKHWWQTYKPILLVFAYITGITILIEWLLDGFRWMRWMNHFMAAFFLVFSFFKFIKLRGFADSYSMYDVLAKRWRGWGYMYAFVELGLGLAFLTGFNPVVTNLVTFVVMSISIVGVLQSVLNKRKIKCACLGDVFNLPMSTVTITEDALMIAMSGIMLINML
ncbi:MAG: heavy-metal-associated domain-containing protein [Chitinophagaceae bacterium]